MKLSLYAQYAALLDEVLDELVADGTLSAELDRKNVTVEPPRDPSHGDLATNAAMVLAKAAKTNPRTLAEAIRPKLEALPPVTSVEVAGPGFINLRLTPDAWRDELRTIIREGEEYGLSTIGGNERVNVEYVSANPTGPLHMGHCRGAVVGDSLARILEAAGFRVTKEYYVNDAGAQVDTLARSLHLRYREALGEDIGEIPEGFYPGDYLKPVGIVMAADYGDSLVEAPEAEWLPIFRKSAIKAMLDLIRYDLGLLGIHHDIFSSENELQQSGAVDRAKNTSEEVAAMGSAPSSVLSKSTTGSRVCAPSPVQEMTRPAVRNRMTLPDGFAATARGVCESTQFAPPGSSGSDFQQGPVMFWFPSNTNRV